MSNFESEMKNSNRVNKLKNEKVRFWLNVGEKNYPKKGEKLRTKLYENLFWKWVVSLDCQTKNVTEKNDKIEKIYSCYTTHQTVKFPSK